MGQDVVLPTSEEEPSTEAAAAIAEFLAAEEAADDDQSEDISPFIEGTNIQWAWDSTSLNYAKTCARLYQYVMIEGWQSENESVHLRFGQELHTAFQQYHIERAAGVEHDDALQDVIHELLHRTWGWKVDTTTRAGKYKNRHSLVHAVISYLDEHAEDPASTAIKEDGAAAVELSFRFEIEMAPRAAPERPYMLCGHLDRVVEFGGDLYVNDYKTTMTTPGSYYFDKYNPDNQMSLYTLAGNMIFKAPVKGVIIDAVQVMVDDVRVVRGMTQRTSGQMDEWVDGLGYWLNLSEYWAESNYYPMNDTACNNYGGCRFRSICAKDASVREQFLKAEFKKGERWNPLKVR